jgi:hypothetical protein
MISVQHVSDNRTGRTGKQEFGSHLLPRLARERDCFPGEFDAVHKIGDRRSCLARR